MMEILAYICAIIVNSIFGAIIVGLIIDIAKEW